MENLYNTNCIRTFSGKHIDVFNLKEEDIDITDIAHALAQMPRFSGHLPFLPYTYSVAQHSCLCSELVEDEFKLPTLLHDTPEYCLLDMPSPIKHRLPDYQKLEHSVMTVIAKKFGIQYPFDKAIKIADKQMLETEWEYIMLGKELPDGKKFRVWSPTEAKETFLGKYYELTKNSH